MSDVPANGDYRLRSLEHRIVRVENLEPAVMKQEISDVKEDIRAIRSAQVWIIRTFVGLCVSLSFAGVSMTILLVRP